MPDSTPPPSHVWIDPSTARPAPYRGIGSELVRWICAAYLKLGGWRLQGDRPDIDKLVLLAAPHTTNWDGLNMLATAGYHRIKLRWMAKKSLAEGPFGWLMLRVGVVPVDRDSRNNLVDQMREAIEAADDMVLAVAPEGTRSKSDGWKTGFYQIALAANVPIVMSVLDYGAKTIRLSGVIYPSGDYAADYKLIREHYAKATGKFPEKFVLPPAE